MNKMLNQKETEIRLMHVNELQCLPPEWLLYGTLPSNALAMLSGEPSCGKSFVCLDWAARIATGTSWHDYAVKPAPVAYISATKQSHIAKRLGAWEVMNGIDLKNAPLALARPFAFSDPSAVERFIHNAKEKGITSGLVIVDDFLRCFAGNENSQKDTNRFIDACNQIRHELSSTVLVVDYDKYDPASWTQGLCNLHAALDADLSLVEQDETLILTVQRLRESIVPPPLRMGLTQCPLPNLVAYDGAPMTSLAVVVPERV